VIESMMTRPPNPASEVADAVASARGGRNGPSIIWPEVDEEHIEEIAQNGMRVLDFWGASPYPMDARENLADEAIDILFPGNPWLCVGWTARSFTTLRREKWRGELDIRSLIVPSPMTSETGLTKSGRISRHSLNNTGPRRFLIVEADHRPLDIQASVIGHLATYAPLAAVVFSGNHSLHGWFVCAPKSEDTLLEFMKYAVSLGADKRMWLRSQFCRIPDGRRSDDKASDALSICGVKGISAGRQAMLYLDPEVIR